MKSFYKFFLVFIAAILYCTFGSVYAIPLSELPGEDISESPDMLSPIRPIKPNSKSFDRRPNNWIAPTVEEQLSRDPTLIPLGKGALFIPSLTEPRREPDITILNARGRQVENGQTGERILIDSGTFTVKFGSGTTAQQLTSTITVEEGHTVVLEPTWGGMLVETLLPDGTYIDAQYEVIRMDKWINYGKGYGLKEERLQDIKSWVLPPGLYRICKPGEGFNSFRNYITVQINEGELTQLELIFDKAGGDLVSGGIKTLNTRIKVGSHWSFGTRIGGNLNLTRVTEENGEKREATRVSSDIRLKLLFDNARYLGTSEFILQDNFSKDNGRPFIVASDFAQVRTNWIRRLNNWLGPYVRSSVETHLFPRKADRDSIYLIKPHEVPTDSLKNPSDTKKIKYDTLLTTGAKGFVIRPALDPTKYSEGMGVNVELFSRYYLEANTQLGFAGRQTVSLNNFATNDGIHYSAEKSVLEVGIENTFNATLRLGSQATLDLNSVIFAVNSDPRDIRLDDFTADLRFFLSRNLEVGYIFHIQESVGLAKNRYPSTHSLSLRLSFNY